MGSAEYVTKRNPDGTVRQCLRTALHGPHEWQFDFGDLFDVYCPGIGVPDEIYAKGLSFVAGIEKAALKADEMTAATILQVKAAGVVDFLSHLTGKSVVEVHADSKRVPK